MPARILSTRRARNERARSRIAPRPRRNSPFHPKRHGLGARSRTITRPGRPGVTPQELSEGRRFVGVPLRLEPSRSRYSIRSYASPTRRVRAAMQMLEGLDDNTDLARWPRTFPSSACSRATTKRRSSASSTPCSRRPSRKRLRYPHRALRAPPGHPFPPGRRAARGAADQARRRAARGVAHQGHVQARDCRAPPPPGRTHLAAHCGAGVDVRVSTLPSGHGERVVLRLLDKQAGRIELTALGMDPHASVMTRSSISRMASSWSRGSPARGSRRPCTPPSSESTTTRAT